MKRHTILGGILAAALFATWNLGTAYGTQQAPPEKAKRFTDLLAVGHRAMLKTDQRNPGMFEVIFVKGDVAWEYTITEVGEDYYGFTHTGTTTSLYVPVSSITCIRFQIGVGFNP